MCGGGVDKVGSKGAGEDNFLMMQIIASYDHCGRHHHAAAMGPHSRQQSIHQSTSILPMQQVLAVKTRKSYNYHYFYDLLRYDMLTNQCDGSSLVVMVVPPMQYIESNDNHTLTLYMPSLMNDVHGLPCCPPWRAWQLKLWRYEFIVAIFAFWGLLC